MFLHLRQYTTRRSLLQYFKFAYLNQISVFSDLSSRMRMRMRMRWGILSDALSSLTFLIYYPPVMPLDAPHRLPQRIRPAMLMIRMWCLMLMKNNTAAFPWILRVMDIPVMPRIPGHYRYIIFIRDNDGKIFRIQTFQFLFTEQYPMPPFGTMLPVLFPQYLPLLLPSDPQNTFDRLLSTAKYWSPYIKNLDLSLKTFCHLLHLGYTSS